MRYDSVKKQSFTEFLEERNRMLATTVDELNTRNKELEEALEAARNENFHLKNANFYGDNVVADLKIALCESIEEKKKLKKDLKSRSFENLSLRDTIAQLKKAADVTTVANNEEHARLEEIVEKLQHDVYDRDIRISALETENQELKKAADSSLAYTKIQRLEAAKKYDHTVISGLRKTTEQLRNENEDLKKKLEQATRTIYIPWDLGRNDFGDIVTLPWSADRYMYVMTDKQHTLLYNLATDRFVYVSNTQRLTRTGMKVLIDEEHE